MADGEVGGAQEGSARHASHPHKIHRLFIHTCFSFDRGSRPRFPLLGADAILTPYINAQGDRAICHLVHICQGFVDLLHIINFHDM